MTRGISQLRESVWQASAMILSKLQNSCPPFPSLLLCSSSSLPTLLPFRCLSSAGISPFVSYIGSDFSFLYTFPCDRCGVRAFNHALPRASADILVQKYPPRMVSVMAMGILHL